MEHGLSVLFRLLSASFVLMEYSGYEKNSKRRDPLDLEDFDRNSDEVFFHDS